MEKFVLIDGNSILNRAFYGIMGNSMLSTPDGVPTNAVYGFLAIMFKILEDIKPEYMAVAFDLKAPTKRHLKYEGYKATRKGMPDELAVQLPIIKEILKAMNIKIMEKEGYEADDILGTLAKWGANENLEVTILTGDRDAFQLASNNITIRIPRTKAGKTEVEDFNEEKIVETYGVLPQKLIEVKGLMGDSSDNIPGVAGVGEKTALQLIKEYQSIDEIYKQIEEDSEKLKGKLKEKLIAGKEMAYLSRELGTIDINADIEKSLDIFKTEEWNKEEVYKIFKNLKFNRYIERFNLEGETKKIDELVKVEKINKLEDIFDIIRKHQRMFFYIETKTSNDETLVIKKEIKSISIWDEENKKALISGAKDIEKFKEILEDVSILKCSNHLKETYILLKQIGIEPKNFMFDIEVAGYLLNSTSSTYTIPELSELYLNINLEENKKEKEVGTQLDLFHQEEETINETAGIYSYCIFSLYDKLKQKLQETTQLELFETIEMPLLEVLAEMQYTGIYINKQELIKFGDEIQEKIDGLIKTIYEQCGIEFNINSPKQLGEVLFDKLQLPVQKKNKSGYSTDVDVLEKLRKYHPVIDTILEYRQLVKLKSTYVTALIPFINAKTQRIHSSFHQTVTATGRISSSDPNLQNIPTRIEIGKKLRKVFKADEGNIFVDADYSQVELRILSHVANDENMIKAFKDGEDIHAQVASQVFHVPIDEVTKEQRDHAKAVNFGIVYGISDFGLSEQLKISKKEAKRYIESYLEKYNGVKEFMDNIIEKAKQQGYVETEFKRRRAVPELNSNSYVVRQFGTRVALNTPIQGTAADIMKIAMIRIYQEFKQKQIKSKIILQVHDEILVETLLEEKEIVEEIVKRNMENAAKLNVPLKVQLSEGKNWYEAK